MYTDETVDRESQQKLYVQILSILRGKIEKGDWTSGDRIPTEVELCKTYSVSKATVRIAIAELVRNGFLSRWQGKGTFVANTNPNPGMTLKTRLTEDMFGEGVNVKKEVIERGVMEPRDDIRSVFLGEEEIYQIRCRRVVEDEPAFIEESFVPLHIFPGIADEDICGSSFYELVQNKASKKVDRVVQNIEITDIHGEAAKVLRLIDGSSVLLLHRLLAGSDGAPIAYTRMYGSGRKYRLQTEFERIR